MWERDVVIYRLQITENWLLLWCWETIQSAICELEASRKVNDTVLVCVQKLENQGNDWCTSQSKCRIRLNLRSSMEVECEFTVSVLSSPSTVGITLIHFGDSSLLYLVHWFKYKSLPETPCCKHPKIMFNWIFGHPVAQWSWSIKVTITIFNWKNYDGDTGKDYWVREMRRAKQCPKGWNFISLV